MLGHNISSQQILGEINYIKCFFPTVMIGNQKSIIGGKLKFYKYMEIKQHTYEQPMEQRRKQKGSQKISLDKVK